MDRARRPELVSVVVCVRNEERYLPRQLGALAAQTYEGAWELVVVDNGSTDRTVAVAEAWRDRLPSVRVVDASAARGLNYARNRGAEAAAGDLLAYADGDDEAVEGWLDGLVSAAAEADLVAGPLDGEALNGHQPAEWIPPDPMTELPLGAGYLRYAPGGNCAVWADVAREVRWNEDYTLGGCDAEFSWRVGLAGGTLSFAPEAMMRRRNPVSLGELAVKYFRYGRAATMLYRDFRASGMPPSDVREAASLWRFILRRAPRAVTSYEFRGRWVRIAAGRLGRVVGSVRHRSFYL
jgi:glycosyltransferase involved in cell wall biosynthesis